MARHYGSFLIRYWTLEGHQSRIEVEHVQSGDHTQVSSLTAGLAWIESRTGQFDQANPEVVANRRDCEEEVINDDEVLG